MIEFKDVTKTFDAKQGAVHAVQDVNLKIEDGHIYGIVGYSGAGKKCSGTDAEWLNDTH